MLTSQTGISFYLYFFKISAHQKNSKFKRNFKLSSSLSRNAITQLVHSWNICFRLIEQKTNIKYIFSGNQNDH